MKKVILGFIIAIVIIILIHIEMVKRKVTYIEKKEEPITDDLTDPIDAIKSTDPINSLKPTEAKVLNELINSTETTIDKAAVIKQLIARRAAEQTAEPINTQVAPKVGSVYGAKDLDNGYKIYYSTHYNETDKTIPPFALNARECMTKCSNDNKCIGVDVDTNEEESKCWFIDNFNEDVWPNDVFEGRNVYVKNYDLTPQNINDTLRTLFYKRQNKAMAGVETPLKTYDFSSLYDCSKKCIYNNKCSIFSINDGICKLYNKSNTKTADEPGADTYYSNQSFNTMFEAL
jgi:hypothetical protein